MITHEKSIYMRISPFIT